MLIQKKLGEVLEAFSDPSPTPGGGSASALAGALGASLLLMVAALPKTRGGEQDRPALDAASYQIRQLRSRLRDFVDLDSEAFDEVVAAYKLPKNTDLEREGRREAVHRALVKATETPLAVMECCEMSLEQALVIAAHGASKAASDVGVAVELLAAGLRGAKLNVEINLEALTDSTYVASVRGRAEALLRKGIEAAKQAREALKL